MYLEQNVRTQRDHWLELITSLKQNMSKKKKHQLGIKFHKVLILITNLKLQILII